MFCVVLLCVFLFSFFLNSLFILAKHRYKQDRSSLNRQRVWDELDIYRSVNFLILTYIWLKSDMIFCVDHYNQLE